MKIGILTLPLNTNYGGILQAYALQTVLERMGHEAYIIAGKSPTKPGTIGKIRHQLSPLKSFFKQYLVPDKYSKDKLRYTRKFVKRWIKQDFYESIDMIPKDKYDAIVVGSDQIWRNKYVEKFPFLAHIETSFLYFAKDWKIKRISYAASFGTEEWEYSEKSTRACADLIKLFDAVSVREKSGIDLCKKYLKHDAINVLDPTMLLSKNDYIQLICKRKKKREGIMCYILDEDEKKSSIVEMVKSKTELNVFKTNVSYTQLSLSKRGGIQPPLEYWLQAFDDADFVITDSFHACVFSIIFNKPFIVIPNITRGASRFYSLLQMFNQEHRIVDVDKGFTLSKSILIKPDCDISKYREDSMGFLKTNIS